MRKLMVLAFVAALGVVLVAQAQLPTNPVKQQELQASGYTSWTPGQNRAVGPAFATLSQSLPAPAPSVENTGTCQYDDGNLTALPIIFGQVYGNRWSLGVAGVQLDTITLNSFSFYFMEDSLPDTGLFFQPAAPMNTMSINALASTNITGLMNSGPNFSAPVLNVINASLLGAGATMYNDTFFLGGWCLNSNTMFPINNEVIGLATNGPRQQGYTAVSGTGAVAFGAQAFNAIIRGNITSPNTVPVELMSFEVGD